MKFPQAKRSLSDIATMKNGVEFLIQNSFFLALGLGVGYIAHLI